MTTGAAQIVQRDVTRQNAGNAVFRNVTKPSFRAACQRCMRGASLAIKSSSAVVTGRTRASRSGLAARKSAEFASFGLGARAIRSGNAG